MQNVLPGEFLTDDPGRDLIGRDADDTPKRRNEPCPGAQRSGDQPGADLDWVTHGNGFGRNLSEQEQQRKHHQHVDPTRALWPVKIYKDTC